MVLVDRVRVYGAELCATRHGLRIYIRVRQKWLEYAQKGICGKKTLATLVGYEHFEKVCML